MIERVLHREHAAPRLADDGVPLVDAEMARQRDELVLEELRRPEVGRRIGQVLAVATAELVVEDARAAVATEIGNRLDVVVRRAGAAVADHDRSLRRLLAEDAVPRLVPVPAEVITGQSGTSPPRG